MQSAQAAGVGRGQPGEQGGHRAAGEELFAGPGGVDVGGMDDDQPRQGQAVMLPGRGMEFGRRRDEDDPPGWGVEAAQGGQEQAEFATAEGGGEDFGEAATRPTAVRQRGVERRVAAGDGAAGGACAVPAAPQVGALEQGVERDGGGWHGSAAITGGE